MRTGAILRPIRYQGQIVADLVTDGRAAWVETNTDAPAGLQALAGVKGDYYATVTAVNAVTDCSCGPFVSYGLLV